MHNLKKEFIDAICIKIGYTEDETKNYFLFAEVVEIADRIHEQDYQAFITALSNHKEYFKGFEKLKYVFDAFDSTYKQNSLGFDKSGFITKLENKISGLDHTAYRDAYDHGYGLTYYEDTLKNLSDNYKNLKNTQNSSYFDEKELYIISSMSGLLKCFSLIRSDSHAFKSKVSIILNTIENKKHDALLETPAKMNQAKLSELNKKLEIKRA